MATRRRRRLALAVALVIPLLSPYGVGPVSAASPVAVVPSAVTGAAGVSAAPVGHKVRTVSPFNLDWRFHYGDAPGAQAPTLADGSWRRVSVPHDWSIEGPNPPANPFAQNARTLGRGGYLPSGIGWYRKHFILAEPPPPGRLVYIEFDG
ncbi:MAG TPA: hypothetical protein VF755_19415, partial [Catenuloplanes sp.]